MGAQASLSSRNRAPKSLPLPTLARLLPSFCCGGAPSNPRDCELGRCPSNHSLVTVYQALVYLYDHLLLRTSDGAYTPYARVFDNQTPNRTRKEFKEPSCYIFRHICSEICIYLSGTRLHGVAAVRAARSLIGMKLSASLPESPSRIVGNDAVSSYV